MKQHLEMIVKISRVKEIQTKSGKWLYSFGVPISKMVDGEQITEWLPVSILQDERRPDVIQATQVHFIGEIVLKEAFGKYPQSLGVFGFFIDPIVSQVYRQRKVQKNINHGG